MRTIALLLAALVFSSAPSLAQDTYVRGYTRSDGTYVQPHYRTAPNNSLYDNYSTQGNVNPYTGQRGTVDPYGLNTRGGNSIYAPNYTLVVGTKESPQ